MSTTASVPPQPPPTDSSHKRKRSPFGILSPNIPQRPCLKQTPKKLTFLEDENDVSAIQRMSEETFTNDWELNDNITFRRRKTIEFEETSTEETSGSFVISRENGDDSKSKETPEGEDIEGGAEISALTLNVPSSSNKSITPKKRYPFRYPTSIPSPPSSLLAFFYDYSLSAHDPDSPSPCSGSLLFRTLSHQHLLSRTNCGLLSLEEVILPSVAEMELRGLKQCQARAQRYKDKEAIKTIEMCRREVLRGAKAGLREVKEERNKRDEEKKRRKRREKMERKRIREEKRKKRFEEKMELKRKKEKEKEMNRQRRKKNLPRNKDLWREVALLMTDLARLEKEEKAWREAKKMLKKMEKKVEKMESQCENGVVDKIEEEEEKYESVDDDVKQAVQNVAGDITLAADRMNGALEEVLRVMEEAEEVKQELYETYKEKLFFKGYKGAKNPKALIRALAMDDTT